MRGKTLLFRHCGQVRRAGAGSAQKGGGTGYSDNLSSARTCAYGEFGILSQSLQYLVILSGGEGRNCYSIHVGIRTHEAGGGAACAEADRKGLRKSIRFRPCARRYGGSGRGRVQIQQTRARHNDLQCGYFPVYEDVYRASNRAELSKQTRRFHRKRKLGTYGYARDEGYARRLQKSDLCREFRAHYVRARFGIQNAARSSCVRALQGLRSPLRGGG